MRKRANILFLLAFVFSLGLTSCYEDKPLTPVDDLQLREGETSADDNDAGNDDAGGGTITDPNDDEDSEVHSGKGKKGKSGGISWDDGDPDSKGGGDPHTSPK